MKTFGIILARESEYCKRKNLQSPEERYQDKKRHWYFHKSSWYMRGIKSGYDGNGSTMAYVCQLVDIILKLEESKMKKY